MGRMNTLVTSPTQRTVTRSNVLKGLQCGLYSCLKVGIYLVFICALVFNVSFLLTTQSGDHEFMVQHQPQERAQRPSEDFKPITVCCQPLATNGGLPAKPRFIEVEVLSSQARAAVMVNQSIVYESSSLTEEGRGIHLVVLCQMTGRVLAARNFDTHVANEDHELMLFIDTLSDGRILIFAVRDEASFSLGTEATQHLSFLGSKLIDELGWKDTWIFIAIKSGTRVAETRGEAPELGGRTGPVILKTRIDLADGTRDVADCQWPNTKEGKRRRHFCSKFEGYGNVCNCKYPSPLRYQPDDLPDNKVSDVPLAVIASNRPFYLLRMLQSLLSTSGVDPRMVTVFTDGYFEGPRAVAELYGLRVIQHMPIGVDHYRLSINTTFSTFPKAKFMILVEEDLEVSLDFLSYFSQTMHLLEEDESLFCISAWNHQGYDHSSQDPSLLYRVEAMPGFGWMITRKLFVDELQPKWQQAEQQADWNTWIRSDGLRKGRECLIPDISRTRHFGHVGPNPYLPDSFFANRSLNMPPRVKLKDVNRMVKDNYEELMHSLVKEAIVLDHTKSPCADKLIRDTGVENLTYVMYIKMKVENDYTTWTKLVKSTCFNLWNLDVRGFHKASWRLFRKRNQLVVIGAPASPYSVHKPTYVTPFSRTRRRRKKTRTNRN